MSAYGASLLKAEERLSADTQPGRTGGRLKKPLGIELSCNKSFYTSMLGFAQVQMPPRGQCPAPLPAATACVACVGCFEA